MIQMKSLHRTKFLDSDRDLAKSFFSVKTGYKNTAHPKAYLGIQTLAGRYNKAPPRV